jgi:CRISPR-associated exonuclease Cas4
MFTEDEMLPISALQHLEYCPRRCALIHVEGIWAENAQTAEGRVLHERAHQAGSEKSNGVRIARRLRLASRTLGLFGVADVVEFHPVEKGDSPPVPSPPEESRMATAPSVPPGVVLHGLAGRWRPFPVEYKRGQRKPEISYRVQLCAQALCLEEMLETVVPCGALYHGKTRRRQQVLFDDPLRQRTHLRARELHELIASGRAPPPVPGPKCKFCSLAGKCVPKLLPSRSARDYIANSIASILGQRE